MTKKTQKEKKERALERALELFAPVYKYAKEDYFERGEPRAWWTKTEIKRICHWRLTGHENWTDLRDMLEKELGLIRLRAGVARCYTFATHPGDRLAAVLVDAAVEAGQQLRTSFVLLRQTYAADFALEVEDLKALEKVFEPLADKVQNRWRFLLAKMTESELLEAGEDEEENEQ